MGLKYKNAAGDWVKVPIPSEINDTAIGNTTTYSSDKITKEDEDTKTELDNTLSINTVTTGELTNALNHRLINTKINAQIIQNDAPSMLTKAPISLANKISIKIQKNTKEKIFNIDLSNIDFVKAKDASDKLIIDNNGYIKIRKNIEKLVITGSEKNIVYETTNSGYRIGIYNLSNKVNKNPTANQISEYWIKTAVDTGATQPNLFSINEDNVRMHCDLETITDKATAVTWLKENQPIFYYESNSPYEKIIGKIDKNYCAYEGNNSIVATAFFGTAQQDIPIEISYAQKINFSEYVTDQNYIHTDNNFTNNDKNTIYSNQWNINNNTDSIIEEQIKNDFKWKSFSGETKYATFTFDDSNTDIDQIEALFEKKNIPCCFATIPSRLKLKCTSTSKTILQVLKEAVANGGEVLSHYTPQINSLSTDEDYIKCYVETKKQLNDAGFIVDGVIVAGGGNDGTPESFKTQDWNKTLKLCRPLYKYSDMVTKIQNTDVEQYNNARIFIDNGYEAAKTIIDDYLDNNNIGNYSRWLNFAGHGTNNIPLDEIEQIIDYVISRGVKIVTWNYIYKNFKTTKLEANKQNKLSTTQLNNINIIPNKQDKLNDEQIANINAVPEKQDKVTYDLICDMTVNENNQIIGSDNRPYVEITTDLNGKAFNYQKVLINVVFPSTISTTVYPYIQIATPAGNFGNLFGYGTKNVKIINGTIEQLPNTLFDCNFTFQTSDYYGSYKISTLNADKYLIQLSGITKIRFMLRQTDMTIPTGTTIKIWGIK